MTEQMHAYHTRAAYKAASRESKELTLHVLEADQRAQWDTFVAADPHGHVLQSWGWGELKAAFGWRALRVALWDKEQEKMLAGAQILFRSLPFTPLSIAYVPKGPVLNWDDPALCQRFFH